MPDQDFNGTGACGEITYGNLVLSGDADSGIPEAVTFEEVPYQAYRYSKGR